jgi:hypothetical protein
MEYLINGIVVVLNIAILFIVVRQNKYFGKKGENQAVIEDIGEITTIVESIKKDLANQNDLIKAQLSHRSKHELELKNEERQAYFDLNRRMSAWLYSMVRFSFSAYSFENYEELKFKYDEFNKCQYEFDVADGHLNLFNQDIDFHEHKLNLEKAILDFEFNLESHIRQLYYVYNRASIVIDSTPTDFKNQAIERDNTRKAHSKISDEYHEKFILLYKDVIDKKSVLVDMINEQLKRMENL